MTLDAEDKALAEYEVLGSAPLKTEEDSKAEHERLLAAIQRFEEELGLRTSMAT